MSLQATRVSAEFRTRRIQVGDIRLNVAERGSGAPVLLLHGFPEAWFAWRDQMMALERAGYRAIAPDMRGYNDSDKPSGVASYRIETLAADIAGLIERLDLGPVPLVAHDWGGIVAQQVALDYPELVSRLLLMSAPHPEVYTKRLLGQLSKSSYVFALQLPRVAERLMRRRSTFLKSFRYSSEQPEAFDDATIDEYVQAMRKPGAATATINYYRAALRHRPSWKRRSIVVPTWLLWGDKDRFLESSMTYGFEQYVDDLTAYHLHDASHWLHHDEPERVSELVLDFLQRDPESEATPTERSDEPLPLLRGTFGGHDLAYADTAPGDQDKPLVVCVHGIPTSGYLYRNVARGLAPRARVLVPDLPGFGASKADPSLGEKAYGLLACSQACEAFVERLAEGRRVHLVLHDIGGPAGLFWATRRPETLASLTILNTTLFVERFRPPLPALVSQLPGVGAQLLERALTPKRFRAGLKHELNVRLSQQALDHYCRPYDDPARRRCLTYTFASYRAALSELNAARARLSRLRCPTRLLFGAADRYCTPPNGHAFAERIPRSELRLLRGVGHFVAEEAPGEVAATVERQLIATGDA